MILGFSVVFFLIKNSQKKIEQLSSLLEGKDQEREQKYRESLFEFQQKIQKDQFELQNTFQDRLGKNFESLDKKVSDKLNLSFEKNTQTIKGVVERLTRIDEAQKKIEELSKNVVSLQDLLSDKKTRGAFGEVQLSQILVSVFGESDRFFKEQYTLPNKTIVDCMLFLPEPMGHLAIDSKFPLENYRRMLEARKEEGSANAVEFTRAFKRDMKKHVDDIAGKYIISGETADQAMMFIPAESIFSEVHSNHLDLVDYAYKKRVWLTSPTTMMAVLSTVQVVLKNQEQAKYADVIQEELRKLSNDFRLYQERWDKLSRHIDTVSKDVKEVNTSSEKISKRFEKIVDLEIGSHNTTNNGSSSSLDTLL